MKNIKKNIADSFDIEANLIECDVSYRGGTLKVNVSEVFPRLLQKRAEDGTCDIELVMGAYQNYLGGGIAGSIVGASMFNPDELNAREKKIFFALKERIKRFFYDVNNGGGDEYMQENVTGKDAKDGYKKLQALSVSAY
jgi:hypothetical protein